MSYQDHISASELRATAIAERRERHDRRRHSWRTITYCGFEGRGRRRSARRNDCDYNLDCYDPKLVITGIAVMVMSYLDALFSLMLLEWGDDDDKFLMGRLLLKSDELFFAINLSV